MNDHGISLAASDLTSASTAAEISADRSHVASPAAVAPRHVTTSAQPTGRPQTIGCAAQSPIEPVMQVRGLKKSYRRGVHEIPVLGGVDLDIDSGEFLSIVGQSGCGKSTLLHLLGTLDKPDEGEIYFEGHRIDNLDPSGCDVLRNKHFGMIFQFYHLLPELDALQNVLTPLLISNGLISYLRHRRQYRQRAMDLPFCAVGEVEEFTDERCDFERCHEDDPFRWLRIQAGQYIERDGIHYAVPPKQMFAFATDPGEGCESANFGLAEYPRTIAFRQSHLVAVNSVLAASGLGRYLCH